MDVVTVFVQVHSELVGALDECTVVGLLADTVHGTAGVVVDPPIVLVTTPPPVHHASRVLAPAAAAAVGVTYVGFPHRVRGVAVDAHVVVVHDTDVGIVLHLGERDFAVVDVTTVAAVVVGPQVVPDALHVQVGRHHRCLALAVREELLLLVALVERGGFFDVFVDFVLLGRDDCGLFGEKTGASHGLVLVGDFGLVFALDAAELGLEGCEEVLLDPVETMSRT